jgi:hypothetical protein
MALRCDFSDLVITPVILAITCGRECGFSDLVIEDVILVALTLMES